MRDRILSTVGLWTVVFLVIWVGGFFSLREQLAFILLAALICAAQWEFYRLASAMPGVAAPRMSGVVAGGALLFALFFVAPENVRASPPLALAALGFGAHLLTLLRRPGQPPAFLRHFPTTYGLLYLPLMLSPLIAIARMADGQLLNRQESGLHYVVWVFVATKFTDVGGLLIGVPFGKHKLAPGISPGKSWEGCLGGLAFSALASAGFAAAVNAWGDVQFMIPWKAGLLALPLALLSIPSDLVESVFKRLAGAKDSGATIPGIGGALDLIDSMVLTSPAALLLLSYCLEWARRA